MISKVFLLFFFAVITCFGISLSSVADNSLTEDQGSSDKGKGPMVGGWSTMDLSNLDDLEKVQKLTDFAMKSLNAKSNDYYHMVRMRILEAKRQLVAGLKYSITFYMGQTDCTKHQVQNEELTAERCPVSDKSEAKFSKCTVTLWEKPWQNYTGLLQDECSTITRQDAMQQNAK